MLSMLAKDCLKREIELSCSVLFQMETRVFLKYLFKGCLCKQFFSSNSPQARSNLIIFIILVTVSSLTQFQPKIRATKLQESC